MIRDKGFKIIILSLCLGLLLCLTACQGKANVDGIESYAGVQESTQSDESVTTETSDVINVSPHEADDEKTSSGDKTSQGIELEEDVFDNSNIQSNTPDNNVSNDDVSDGSNSDENVSGDNNSEDSSFEDSSSDNDIAEENTSSSDGIIKLPVDWFD